METNAPYPTSPNEPGATPSPTIQEPSRQPIHEPIPDEPATSPTPEEPTEPAVSLASPATRGLLTHALAEGWSIPSWKAWRDTTIVALFSVPVPPPPFPTPDEAPKESKSPAPTPQRPVP